MPPDLALSLGAKRAWALDPVWKSALIRLGVVWASLIAVFAADWLRIFDQWWHSSTYGHMLLIPPMVAWLVYQRRTEILQLHPQGWARGILAVMGVLVIWVLGAVSGLDLLRQSAVVALLPATLLVLLGPKVFAGLLFPLCFMAFMVPFGDEFVPALQMVTATLTIALVRLSGIPASIDGVFIDTPAGLFEVAEACSGVKFLIAMIALGAFVAHVAFRSPWRRALFMALCVVAPILANGLRAFGTILAAQYVGAEKAGGIDHLIYGWVFFALVIAAVLGIAWRWFDRPGDDPMLDPQAIDRSKVLARLTGTPSPAWSAMLAIALPLAGSLLWVRAADELTAPLPAQVGLPEVPGWQRDDYAPSYPWQPRAAGADHRRIGRYRNAAGRQVDVFVAQYAAQREGKEAGGAGEGALPSNAGWSWRGNGPSMPSARTDRLRAEQGTERIAETYYRTGALLTGSNGELKLAVIRDRVLLRPRATMLLILSSELHPGRDAAADLAAFRAAIGPVGQWMDRIGSGR
ncbi:exosortase A [Novosphingobium aquiterrae]|uniref:Exosortase A n=1 Tax=Novosphingobium aquiterrae TaxID=624388 RepID=A0ABV6PH02_9SPHN